MDTMQLRYFISVAEQLSFTAAATRFGISQPTVGRQLSALEEELGVRLLTRSTHGISLTTAGVECLDYARKLLDLEDRALSCVENISDGCLGTLRVAALYSSTKDLEDCLAVFALRFPHIRVDIDLLSHIYTTDSQEMSDYDFFFAQSTILAGQNDLEHVDSHSDQFHLVMHEKDAPPGQDLSLLSERPFLTVDRSHNPLMMDQIMSICQAMGFAPKLVGHYNQYQAALIAVNAGMGITILPHSILNGFRLEHIASLPIPGEDARIASVIAWHKNSGNAAVAPFAEVIRELYQRTPGG
jgi:DNA-binding transcriptional LysR family regulator